MHVAIEIRHTLQDPADCDTWTESATLINVVVQIPDRCLARVGVLKHIVWVAIAVKVDHCSPCRNVWLESHSCNIASGGKDGAHSARGKLKNVAADPILGDKQIVRTVNGQTARNYWILIVFRGAVLRSPAGVNL